MTTVSGGVAVVATHLVQTDRRALSEAWYSALHLAGRPIAAPRSVARAGASAPRTPATNARRTAPAGARTPGSDTRPLHARERANVFASEGERRRPITATERRIERAVERLTARRPLPAAHTVDVAGGRVRLLVHDDGRATRIIALCSHALREPVERALASARFALAGRGIVVGAP